MTPARAAEVLRKVTPLCWPPFTARAMSMGADALEFVEWLFSYEDDMGYKLLKMSDLLQRWHGEDSFLDYCRAEWEKERKG